MHINWLDLMNFSGVKKLYHIDKLLICVLNCVYMDPVHLPRSVSEKYYHTSRHRINTYLGLDLKTFDVQSKIFKLNKFSDC